MQGDELGKRRNRVSRAPLDLGRVRHVAEDERVGGASVIEAERDPGELRVDDRSLALDEEKVAAARTLDDEALRGAGEEVRDDGIDRDSPAGDRDACLTGRDEDGAEPRSRAPRSSSMATDFLPIAQSEPTVRTTAASSSRFAPVGTLRSDGGMRRSRISTPRSVASALSSASSDRCSCMPDSRSSPASRTSRRSVLHSAEAGRPPARRPRWPCSRAARWRDPLRRSRQPAIPSTSAPAFSESTSAETGWGP